MGLTDTVCVVKGSIWVIPGDTHVRSLKLKHSLSHPFMYTTFLSLCSSASFTLVLSRPASSWLAVLSLRLSKGITASCVIICLLIASFKAFHMLL